MLKRLFLLAMMALSILSCATTDHGSEYRKDSHSPLSFIEVYRNQLNHLSAVRAGECPMHPSCSKYSAQAFEKHGLFVGWMMTLDRLMRCGRDDMQSTPLIHIHGEWKRYDPLEANDFWWTSPKKNCQEISLTAPPQP